MKYIDLHVHSNFSDGSLPPSELVRSAKYAGLKAIAVTDHDTMGGISEAIEHGNRWGVEIVPGVEISTAHNHGKTHILGYFCEPDKEPLKSTLEKIRISRWNRIVRICEKLSEFGIYIDYESELRSGTLRSIGRPHIAALMKRHRYVSTIWEAFQKYLADGKSCFVEKWAPDPLEVIDIIHKSSGIAVLAHPGPGGNSLLNILDDMIEKGLDGIEAFYPTHDEEQTKFFRDIAKRNNLLVTGGSDYHGINSDRDLFGIFKIKYSYLVDMKKYVSKS